MIFANPFWLAIMCVLSTLFQLSIFNFQPFSGVIGVMRK